MNSRAACLLALAALAFCAVFVTLSCSVVDAPHLAVTVAALCWVPALFVLFVPEARRLGALLGGAGAALLAVESLGLAIWHLVLAIEWRDSVNIYIASTIALACQAVAAAAAAWFHFANAVQPTTRAVSD